MAAIQIPALDEKMGNQVSNYVKTLTVPLGALGRLEELVIELAKMTGEAFPKVTKPGVIVFAGIMALQMEGVSAYPKEVTVQMVRNFLSGGAAINVFSRAIDDNLRIFILELMRK